MLRFTSPLRSSAGAIAETGNAGHSRFFVAPLFPYIRRIAPPFATGEGRKRGFDKRESLGRERGRFGGGEGTFLQKGSLSPSKSSYPSSFIRLDDTGGKKETPDFTTIEGTCHVSHPHAFIGPGLQALHGRALHRRESARSTVSNGSSSSPAMKTPSEPLRWSSIRWKRMSDWHSAIRRPETPAL